MALTPGPAAIRASLTSPATASTQSPASALAFTCPKGGGARPTR
jgi:hypothetical protein